MTSGQRTIATLLTAITVLLAANLIIRTSKPVEAAGAGPGEPYVVQITGGAGSPSYLQRLWSDGAIDQWKIVQSQVPPLPIWEGWLDFDPVQRADLDADGCVGIQDFLMLLADWDDPCES